MNFLKSFIVLTFMVILTSCGSKTEEVAKPAYQSFEMQGKDTINKVDLKGLKQGQWFFYANKDKKSKDPKPPKLLVSGSYEDDKREGIWYYYSAETGTVTDTVFYQNDFPQDK